MSDVKRAGTIASLRAAFSSRRIGAVTLQSFSSGLPLGLVWIALPAFLTYRGFDIRTVGLFSLAQAPWSFKFLWSPLMDRFGPRLGRLGRRRSWIVICQAFLMLAILALAGFSQTADVAVIAVIALLIAFGSASQDIVIDAYAVEVLERSEQGLAVGARNALARSAVLIAGALTITAGQRLGWPPVFAALGLLFVPLVGVVLWSPEPEFRAPPPRSLRHAVFDPLIELFRRSGALPILGFLVLYKFGENLATALIRPFLIQKCYLPEDVGVGTASIGLVALIVGAFLGGLATDRIGLTRSLWLFGAIQSVGFLGYVVIDQLTPGSPCAGGVVGAIVQPLSHRLTMLAAIAAENVCQGMATGAFGVMLLRMTQKQFSATQYALFSSIFAVGRIVTGPIAGFTADAVGWTPFYLLATAASIPGLLLLQRFAPLGGREPALEALEPAVSTPVTRARLATTGVVAAVLGFAAALGVTALLTALKAARLKPEEGVAFVSALLRILSPVSPGDWSRVAGLAVVGLLAGAGSAAFLVARHGLKADRRPPGSPRRAAAAVPLSLRLELAAQTRRLVEEPADRVGVAGAQRRSDACELVAHGVDRVCERLGSASASSSASSRRRPGSRVRGPLELGRAGRAARPADGADHRHRRVVCALRRSSGAAARADRRHGGGRRPDHVDGGDRWRCRCSITAPWAGRSSRWRLLAPSASRSGRCRLWSSGVADAETRARLGAAMKDSFGTLGGRWRGFSR